MMPGAVDRKFWPIFMFSLVLHGIALAWVKGVPNPAPPLLTALIAQLRVAVAPAAAATPSGPTAAARATPAPAVVPQQARQLPSRREHRSVRAVAEAAAPPVSAPAVAAAPVPVAAETLPKVVEAPAPAPRPQGPMLDAYRQRLTELFASQQQYPRVAALRGWEGQVRLRLRVARKGNLIGVQLDHSSGFEVLDQHALAMLEQLAGLPPLPEGLESNEIQVVVPINYKLKKTT